MNDTLKEKLVIAGITTALFVLTWFGAALPGVWILTLPVQLALNVLANGLTQYGPFAGIVALVVIATGLNAYLLVRAGHGVYKLWRHLGKK